MDGQIHKAKSIAWIALMASILLGVLLGLPFTIFSQRISGWFINSGESIDVLSDLFEKYVMILP